MNEPRAEGPDAGLKLALPNAGLKEASELDPKDAYSALWLDIADRRNNIPSHLAQAAMQLDMQAWPAPVVRLFVGEMTPAATLAATNDKDPKKKRAQVCQANLYGAEFVLLQKQKEEALRLYREAASDCPKSFIEWAAATAALRSFRKMP
jgi:lipoprotein NlpI